MHVLWSGQQSKALKKIHQWLKDPKAPQVFHCFGFAGVGKTSIALEASSACEGNVIFCAPTARAAHVMESKGCKGAMTLHRAIYRAIEHSDLRLTKLLKQRKELTLEEQTQKIIDEINRLDAEINSERKKLKNPNFSKSDTSSLLLADLCVLDEGSMVNRREGEDLLSFGKKILVLADPFQLPPVMGAGFFNTETPEVLLTEILRQELDSPIVALATRVRTGRTLEFGTYGDSQVIPRGPQSPEFILGHDQVLCGRNSTRRTTINKIRRLRDYGNFMYPRAGERLICLRNNHDLALANGALFTATQDAVSFDEYSKQILLHIEPEDGGVEIPVVVHPHHFEGRGDELVRPFSLSAEEFDYGWAITVHKAQGSQWDRVALVNEASVFNADTAQRWLYTGITRAAKSISILQ